MGGGPETLVARLEQAGNFELPVFEEPENDPSSMGDVLAAARHWFACIHDQQCEAPEYDKLTEQVQKLRAEHERAFRAFVLAGRMHPGAAYLRLCAFSSSLLPLEAAYAPSNQGWDLLLKWIATLPRRRIANAALDIVETEFEKSNLEDYRTQVLRDLDSCCEALVARLGLHISRRRLVLRFKQRCEQFQADLLRSAIEKRTPRKPEDTLTLAAAEYFFDAGLNPLFNAEIVRLRPDLFEASGPHAFYLEAKQYDGKHPTSKLLRAVWQVWDTWHGLDAHYDVREAFLLVFRRGGPLVEFEDVARHDGRFLYPVVVDISPTAAIGSRATLAPVRITEAEMMPKTPDVSRRAHRRRT